MTHEEVKTMVESIGFPSAYHHFAQGESPDPPFVVYLYPNADNFAADGIVYFSVNVLNIELYTDKKDPDVEAQVEAVLTENGIYYEKSEVWIESERLYEVLYEMEV
ncbi:MAG: hypothetical protein LUD12_13105 [Lachnospiraceae bacterium]|nr:hypothetical protein [Lachnospiraceae bacterium]